MSPILYYCDHYPIPLPPGHKFPLQKYSMLRSLLELHRGFELRPAPPAETAQLLLAHDAGYVNSILDGSVDAALMRRIGFPWTPDLVRRTLASVGGTVAAARQALTTGVGGNLAGGTHHAFRDAGSGFCVFNDLAVAICVLQQEGAIRRTAVLDLDVHQGDGTASIFTDDPNVFTISIHGSHNFPFRKQTGRIDIGLPDGTSDREYLDQLRKVLRDLWEFRPDLLLYQSGVDTLKEDRLGRLSMTHAGLMERDRLVFEEARYHRVPVAVTLGGGYAEPVELTVEAHANTFHLLAEIWSVDWIVAAQPFH